METQDMNGGNDRVEQIMTVIRQRYGDRLDEGELGEVEEAAKAMVQAGADMRAVELGHSDLPFSVPPYRRD